jgi:Putative transposase
LDQIPPAAWAVDWNVNAQAVGNAANSLSYLARYVFKVAISESRITGVDDTHVSFTYRKVHSHRVRAMRLPIFAFMHRFLQHVLPSGFMKVRYFGFLSASFKMPFDEIKARIELAQGFQVGPPPAIEAKAPQPLCCPRCGARLRYRCTLFPRAAIAGPIHALAIRALSATTMHPLNSGP